MKEQEEKTLKQDRYQLPNKDCAAKPAKIEMQWSIKSISGSPRDVFWLQLITISAHIITLTYAYFILWSILMDEPVFLVSITALLSIQAALYIMAIRTKTLYQYNIHSTHGELEYQLQPPMHTSAFFKGFAFVGIFLLILMALMAGSLLFLTGVGAMAFMAAMRLLTWKNPIKREWSGPWDEYNFVTVDRKRRVVVTHITDTTLGFEARLPDDALFEQYLAFLRSVLPPTAQFTEKKWDMSLI
ncbi:permease [Pseudomonas sp. R1-18]|uniref:permease n=1 Tax=Pseudomonas sp. R1-18 TaxID=1632772 RepID=UPI003DA93E10